MNPLITGPHYLHNRTPHVKSASLFHQTTAKPVADNGVSLKLNNTHRPSTLTKVITLIPSQATDHQLLSNRVSLSAPFLWQSVTQEPPLQKVLSTTHSFMKTHHLQKFSYYPLVPPPQPQHKHVFISMYVNRPIQLTLYPTFTRHS